MLTDIANLWLADPVITDNSVVIDWTSIIIAVIGASAAMFSAYMAAQAVKVSKNNSFLLKTNSGKTIGQHVEDLKKGQLILRNEMADIAEEKVTADALLASASLDAIARLAVASDVHIQEIAVQTAKSILSEAKKTASTLLEEREQELGALIVEHEKEAAQNGQNRRFYDPS